MAVTFLLPNADVDTTGWTANSYGQKVATNLFSSIDEVTSDGNATFIHSNALADQAYATPYKCDLQLPTTASTKGIAVVTAALMRSIPSILKCDPRLEIQVLDEVGVIASGTLRGEAFNTVYFDFSFTHANPPTRLSMVFTPWGHNQVQLFCCITQAMIIALS